VHIEAQNEVRSRGAGVIDVGWWMLLQAVGFLRNYRQVDGAGMWCSGRGRVDLGGPRKMTPLRASTITRTLSDCTVWVERPVTTWGGAMESA
jgi:hypothetical protein